MKENFSSQFEKLRLEIQVDKAYMYQENQV